MSPANHPGDGRNTASLLLLAGALLLYVAASATLPAFVPDDSYISFRYAENLARGHGLTFNADEAPVEGYSNFLWILFCAVLVHLGLKLPLCFPGVGLLLGLANLALLWTLLRRRGWGTARQAVPLVALATCGPFLLYAVSGMETPLFTLLILASIHGLLRFDATESRGAGLVLALYGVGVALCRPEGAVVYPALVGALVAGSWLGLRRRRSWSGLFTGTALFAVALAVYNGWRWHYFGGLLPTPLLSKGAGGTSLFGAWQTNFRFYFDAQTHHFAPFGFYYIALLLLAGLALAQVRRHRARYFPEVAALVLALTLGAVYINFVDWMPAMRYFVPVAALLVIPLALLVPDDPQQTDTAARWRQRRGAAVLCAAVALVNLFGFSQLRSDAASNATSTEVALVRLGHWLGESLPAGTVLAMSDVGATPYYSALPTVDINPESLTDLHIATHGWSGDYVLDRNPGVVVFVSFSLTRPSFYPEHLELLRDPRFAENYRLIGVTRYDWHLDRCYWTFVRNDVPLADESLERFPRGLGSS